MVVQHPHRFGIIIMTVAVFVSGSFFCTKFHTRANMMKFIVTTKKKNYSHLPISKGFINPQTFMLKLNKVCAELQEHFHCLAGANIYLTPPNSQGFAPHYDDIEAFVLQIEGQKKWLLYPPRENEELPRESSMNFLQDEIGSPIFERVLRPGDLLYFPRGWIHQAKTVENEHSLHITLSLYQKTSVQDLFEELLKDTLKKAAESSIEYRKGLPLDIWNQFGETYAENNNSSQRNTIKERFRKLFRKLEENLDLDSAVDNMAIKYQHDALPPVFITNYLPFSIFLTFSNFFSNSYCLFNNFIVCIKCYIRKTNIQVLSTAEKERTIYGTSAIEDGHGHIVMPEINENTEIRLTRANICRLKRTDDVFNLYYYADNSKEYHGSDMNFIEIEAVFVPIIKELIKKYPKYVKISSLSKDVDEATAVAESLWDRGIVMTKKPLE